MFDLKASNMEIKTVLVILSVFFFFSLFKAACLAPANILGETKA